MEIALDILSWLLLTIGGIFVFIGGLGHGGEPASDLATELDGLAHQLLVARAAVGRVELLDADVEMAATLERQPRWLAWLLPIYVGLVFATVYGRFHYVLDIIAGLLLALVIVAGYRFAFRRDAKSETGAAAHVLG